MHLLRSGAGLEGIKFAKFKAKPKFAHRASVNLNPGRDVTIIFQKPFLDCFVPI